MAVKLHRCRFEWLKTGPCWKVEKALKDMGIDYELAPGPSRPSKRNEDRAHGAGALSGDRVRGRNVVPRGVEGHGEDDPRGQANGARGRRGSRALPLNLAT